MKKLLLFTVAIFFVLRGSDVKAQGNTTAKMYMNIMDTVLELYNCNKEPYRQIHPKAFDAKIKPALSMVLTGNDNLTSSTTAANFENDKDKGTININVTQAINPRHYFNIGAFATSKEGLFGIYTDDSWNSNIGLNLGYTHARSSMYFDTVKCKTLNASRKKFADSLLTEYKILIIKRASNIDTIDSSIIKTTKRIKTLKDTLGMAININNYDSVNHIQSLLLDAQKRLDSITIERAKYDTIKSKHKEIVEQLENIIITYDSINSVDKYNGYFVHWTATTVAISNNTIQLDNKKLPETQKAKLSAKNQYNLSLSNSYNLTINVNKALIFTKANLTTGITNILSHPQYESIPVIQYDSATTQYYAATTDGTIIKKYEDIKPDIFYTEISCYGAFFFVAKKSIGFDITASVKYSNDPIAYPFLHSLTIGPIFLVNAKDGYSKGTVGIQCGLVNATDLRQDISKYFGVTLKVGLPFSAFTGSSGKKE